jgi:hypothetical protein
MALSLLFGRNSLARREASLHIGGARSELVGT